MVTIVSMRESHCTLCQEKSQGVDAEFKDGTKVYLCKKHFWQALQARSEAAPGREVSSQHQPLSDK